MLNEKVGIAQRTYVFYVFGTKFKMLEVYKQRQ